MFNAAQLPAARKFIAQVFADAIKAEVTDEHRILNECQAVLADFRAEQPISPGRREVIREARDWLDMRSDTIHFAHSRAAMVAYAGKDLAVFVLRGGRDDLTCAFRHLAALHLPEKTHQAMWDFLRGYRDDSTLPAAWAAFLQSQAA